MIPLALDLERALLRALADAWHRLNGTHFKNRLQPPAFALSDGEGRLGRWCRESRTIELGRRLCLERDWGVVIEVLKHEMAHQFVSEVLGDPDGAPHGEAFRRLCERLGIDGRPAGLPEAGEAPPAEEARTLQRIARLLALAESANVHEAEAAAAEAQRLMLKYNLSAPLGRGYAFRHLGRPKGRTSEPDRLVGGILSDFFFVDTIWVPVWRAKEGKRGLVLEAVGTPANLELAAWVHAFLHDTADRLWRAYKRARGLRGDRDRLSYLAGVMAGFRERLTAERKKSEAEGLVWVGDADLMQYLKKRHPYVRTAWYGGQPRGEAHHAGVKAGRDVVLRRPVSAWGAAGRLLPARR